MERGPIFLIEPVPGIERQELDSRFPRADRSARQRRVARPSLEPSESCDHSSTATVAPQGLPGKSGLKPDGRAGRMRTNRREHSRRPNGARRTLAGHVRRMRVTECSRIATQLLPESTERRKHSEIVPSTLGSGPRGRWFESTRPDHQFVNTLRIPNDPRRWLSAPFAPA